MTLRSRPTLPRRRVLFLGMSLPLPFIFGCTDSDSPAQAPAATDTAAGSAPSNAQPAAPTGRSTASSGSASTTATTLPPTPACGDDDDEPTAAQTEGPYFTPGSPERASLIEPGINGTRLVVAGSVLSTGCAPIAKALVDFWQCDDAGVYDNTGFKLRGHQFTDGQGRYRLETIVPGVYPGRTRHIHLKVQAPNRPVLTTQLYFPNEPANARDGIYRSELEMQVRSVSGGQEGAFDFVLEA